MNDNGDQDDDLANKFEIALTLIVVKLFSVNQEKQLKGNFDLIVTNNIRLKINKGLSFRSKN